MSHLARAWQRISESGTHWLSGELEKKPGVSALSAMFSLSRIQEAGLLGFTSQLLGLARDESEITEDNRSIDDCSDRELDELAIPEFDPRHGADTINW
ncbi:MAG: hypothetical protein AB7K24_34475 [Gemmataceae bacterium]